MPEVVADRYEVGDRLGAGGISDVFAAYDRRLDRRVAVKFLRTGIGDVRARARFEREARMAASFNHPHAVAIYDVGERDGQPYLVLELVDGLSLSQMLAERKQLEPGEAVAIADQVLDALGAAHAQGLVHRDVKPGNILLTREHVAKLADFGIAKAVADATGSVTMTGELIGTPRYLSPEQVAGQPATPWSDLYAVGVVLYEMLAGAPPFSGETPIATALAHQHEPVPSLASRRAGLDPRLVAVVERALEKDPSRRFADAAEMRGALAFSPVVVPEDAATLAGATMLADGATPTQTLPAPVEPAHPAPARTDRGKAPWAWIAGALVLLAVVLGSLAAGVFSSGNGDNLVSSAGPTTTAVPTTEAPTTVPTTTTSLRPTVPPTTLPSTIDALVATLAANPDAYGPHAKDLLTSLQQIQRASAKKPGDKSVQMDAAKTIDEVGKWMADGTLDRTIGTVALQLLQPYAGATTRKGP